MSNKDQQKEVNPDIYVQERNEGASPQEAFSRAISDTHLGDSATEDSEQEE